MAVRLDKVELFLREAFDWTSLGAAAEVKRLLQLLKAPPFGMRPNPSPKATPKKREILQKPKKGREKSVPTRPRYVADTTERPQDPGTVNAHYQAKHEEAKSRQLRMKNNPVTVETLAEFSSYSAVNRKAEDDNERDGEGIRRKIGENIASFF